eukprot:9903974-Lingulodinium_polyedra.AAC.1
MHPLCFGRHTARANARNAPRWDGATTARAQRGDNCRPPRNPRARCCRAVSNLRHARNCARVS